MPHYQSFRYFIKKHVNSAEINFGIKTKGNKNWQSLYNFPAYGIGIYYADLGNNEVLGDVKAIYGYFNTSLFDRPAFKLKFNFATGISYLKTVFDAKTNYYNLALSSHFNAYLHGSVEAKLRISKKIVLVNGIGLTHYSNGALKMPNRGLNVVSYRFGLDYMFNSDEIKISENPQIEKFRKFTDLFLSYSFGLKRIYPVSNDKVYFVSVLNADYGINLNQKIRFGIGIEAVNNPSKILAFEKQGNTNPEFPDYISAGFHLSCDIKIGDVYFMVNQGFNVYDNLKNSAKLFHRFGFKYKITENVFLNLALNTYFFRAEWIEWGAGVYF